MFSAVLSCPMLKVKETVMGSGTILDQDITMGSKRYPRVATQQQQTDYGIGESRIRHHFHRRRDLHQLHHRDVGVRMARSVRDKEFLLKGDTRLN